MLELLRQNHDMLALTILLGVSVVANIVIHWFIVCPQLYRSGSRFPTGLLFWRVFAELRRYRDVVSGQARPLTFFYLEFILTWFNFLLAFGIALRLLWQQTHPYG